MANEFRISINTDNAAFDDPYGGNAEVARILREVADRVGEGTDSGIVRDVNGNKVGNFGFVLVP